MQDFIKKMNAQMDRDCENYLQSIEPCDVPLKTITEFCIDVDNATTYEAIKLLRNYLIKYAHRYSLISLRFMSEHFNGKYLEILMKEPFLCTP